MYVISITYVYKIYNVCTKCMYVFEVLVYLCTCMILQYRYIAMYYICMCVNRVWCVGAYRKGSSLRNSFSRACNILWGSRLLPQMMDMGCVLLEYV